MPGEPPGSPGHFLFVTGQKKPRPGAGALGLRDSDETLSWLVLMPARRITFELARCVT